MNDVFNVPSELLDAKCHRGRQGLRNSLQRIRDKSRNVFTITHADVVRVSFVVLPRARKVNKNHARSRLLLAPNVHRRTIAATPTRALLYRSLHLVLVVQTAKPGANNSEANVTSLTNGSEPRAIRNAKSIEINVTTVTLRSARIRGTPVGIHLVPFAMRMLGR